jgi:hypothetical protein
MQKRNVYILAMVFAIAFVSCTKENEFAPEFFYGKWKASYGDTVIFSQKNGINTATYNYSMNPLLPTRGDYEFAYRDGRLGVKRLPASDFTFFSSFRWTQPGQSFEIRGIEWFSFVNSTGTYFSFARIP